MADPATVPDAAPYRLAVIMERGRVEGRWAGDTWEAKGIVQDLSPAGSAERVILEDAKTKQILFPGMTLRLTPAEAEGYLLNLTSPHPKVFVLWRMEEEVARPKLLTVSYHEGMRWADSDEHVDGVALPPDLVPWIAQFAQAYYRPEPKKKPRYASSKDKGVASRR
jgi:hypothetical protein